MRSLRESKRTWVKITWKYKVQIFLFAIYRYRDQLLYTSLYSSKELITLKMIAYTNATLTPVGNSWLILYFYAHFPHATHKVPRWRWKCQYICLYHTSNLLLCLFDVLTICLLEYLKILRLGGLLVFNYSTNGVISCFNYFLGANSFLWSLDQQSGELFRSLV